MLCKFFVTALALVTWNAPAVAQIVLPNAAQTCPTDENAEFATWWGNVRVSGFVEPPKNLEFENTGYCSFYMSAARMFLWLTSPTPLDNLRVFETPIFYQVSPTDAHRTRQLLVNDSALNKPNRKAPDPYSKLKKASVSIAQFGTEGNAVVLDGSRKAVLMAQAHKKLVYFTIEVNDIYAYFLTGTKTVPPQATAPAIAESYFPVSDSDLRTVENFAGREFPNRDVLAVQLKLAWIEAAGLRSIDKYITTWANIPKFIERDQGHWVGDGWKPAKLALVGMHIAFVVKGHREMVWATFEHVNDTANPAYCYNDGHSTKVNPPNLGGSWLFSPARSRGGRQDAACTDGGIKNVVADMYLSGGDIYAGSGHIQPSNVLRMNPWGFPPSHAGENTEIISLNASVQRRLPPSDVRRNYIFMGATWRFRGDALQEGSVELANTTMETFLQGIEAANHLKGCIGCHQGYPDNMLGFSNGGVSHIYCQTNPLPVAEASTVPGPGCERRR